MSQNRHSDSDQLELLIIRCQLGERDAFEQLIQTHFDALKRHLARVCGDPQIAADLAQEIWLKVFMGLGSLKEPRRFRSWLFAIAHRKLMDRFRAQYRQAINHHLDVDALEDSQDLKSRFEHQHDLDRALQALTITDRETLRLVYVEGLTLQETADCLAVPLGTIKSRLHRGRRQLRQQIAPEAH